VTYGVTQPAASVEQLTRRWLRFGFELRTPIAERLERDAFSLAIFSLVQVATAPGVVMRSPECLVVASPRPVLIRHFVLLVCKSQARTDRDPDTPPQVCKKWTLTVRAREFAVRQKKFPVPSKKFPVPLRREVCCNRLNLLGD
jgi:hypothetical protein